MPVLRVKTTEMSLPSTEQQLQMRLKVILVVAFLGAAGLSSVAWVTFLALQFYHCVEWLTG